MFVFTPYHPVFSSCNKMIRSTSSQDDESVFLDDGLLLVFFLIAPCYFSLIADEDPTTASFSMASNNPDSATGKTNSFFAENYDHDNLGMTTVVDGEEIEDEVAPELEARQLHRRKS